MGRGSRAILAFLDLGDLLATSVLARSLSGIKVFQSGFITTQSDSRMASLRPGKIWRSDFAKRLGVLFGFVSGQKATGYDYLRIALGCLLLVTAGLKTHQLATEPILGHSIFDSRWILIAAVEFEIFFGLWLLRGLLPRLTWMAAIGCFSLFACVSLYKALSGEVSCGCFGKVEVNPWIVTSFDIFVCVSLILSLPAVPSIPSSCDINHRTRALLLPHSLLLVTSLALPCIAILTQGYNTEFNGDTDPIGKSNIVLLTPRNWVGHDFPLFNYMKYDRMSQQSRDIHIRSLQKSIIYLFRYSCPQCMKKLEEAKAIAAKEGVDNIVLAGIGQPSGNTTTPGCVLTQLNGNVDWILKSPVVLVLLNGKVTHCIEL